MKIIFGIVLFLFLIGMFSSNSSNTNKATSMPTSPTVSSKPGEGIVGNKGVVYQFTKRLVQQNLKAPTTAKFPGISAAEFRRVDDITWIVHCYVDSQNAFGAMIRTHYRAKVMFLGNDTWKLLDLQTE